MIKKLRVLQSLAALTLILALTGCSSTPIHYHTLVPAADEGEKPANKTTKTVQISSLTLPAPVDRSQIVVRSSDSGLAILESDWWSASLVEELRSALNAQLAEQSVPTMSEEAPAVHLDVDIRRFDSVPNSYALIDAQWSLAVSLDSKRSELTCSAIFRTPADDGLDALILAQQTNVQEFAGAINRSVSELLAEQSACQ